MKNSFIGKKMVVFVLVISICISVLAGCSKKSDSGAGSDTTKQVNLVMYLWGSAGVDNKFAMDELNKKLKAKINATLEIKYIPWDAVTTKYPLILASGEPYDMIYTSSAANPNYFSLSEKGSFKDLTTLLPKYAPKTWAKISQNSWEDTKYKGKIYSVPSAYSEYIPKGLVYRGDLLKKYGMQTISSIDDMEKYYDNVLKNEKGMIPWDANSSNSNDLYGMFTESTSTWITAPGIDLSSMYLVAKSKSDITDIFDPAFTDEFSTFAVKMKQWADKGYWSQDVLSTKKDPVAAFNNATDASYFHHAQGFVGGYGGLIKALPNSDPQFFGFGEASKKVIKTRTMQNGTSISANSKNPERSLMMLDLLMNDKEIYDLFQYGVKGRNYDLDSSGKRITPANFDDKKSAYGQSAWSTRTDEFEIQLATDYSGRTDMNKKYDDYAVKDPYSNFNFDSKNVAAQIAAVTQVNATYGVPILFGKAGDAKKAVEAYRSKLKVAGIDQITAELKKQLKDYKPAK